MRKFRRSWKSLIMLSTLLAMTILLNKMILLNAVTKRLTQKQGTLIVHQSNVEHKTVYVVVQYGDHRPSLQPADQALIIYAR